MNELLMQLIMSGKRIIIIPGESEDVEDSDLFNALKAEPNPRRINPVPSPG